MEKQKAARKVKNIVKPVEKFLHMEASGGILLILATVAAMIWVNSMWSGSYFQLWERHLSIGLGDFLLSKELTIWVNDALMAIFFFFVGLEIKREMLAGELTSLREASLPISAAIGGMLIPASMFVLLNLGKTGTEGWGIPMATDIAFSIGILTLLGKRVPVSLKVFLTALAIVDDIGAVLVIAVFYSAEIYWNYLIYAGGLYIILLIFNFFYLRYIPLYIIIGIVMWYYFLKSGIHPTVCGVLVAFTIPARRKINLSDFIQRTRFGLSSIEKSEIPESHMILNTKQINTINIIEEASDKVQSPLQRLENSLHDWIIFFIMPVFALANAAVVFETGILDVVTSHISLNIAASLVFGKALGITFFAWLAVKMKMASFPKGVRLPHILGVGFLGGIGFTMSLFITNLAFDVPVMIQEAKLGILLASFVAGVSGYLLLKYTLPKNHS